METTRAFITFLAIVSAGVLSCAADPLPPLAKAEQLIVPKLSLKEATVHEAVQFLTRMSRKLDPAKTGVEIVFAAPADDQTRISMDFANESVAGAAKKIADAAKLEMRVEGESIVLKSTRPPTQKPAVPAPQGIPGLQPVPRAPGTGTPGPGIPGLKPVPGKPVAPAK